MHWRIVGLALIVSVVGCSSDATEQPVSEPDAAVLDAGEPDVDTPSGPAPLAEDLYREMDLGDPLPSRSPDYLVDCQPARALWPPEKIDRGEPPTTSTLTPIWSTEPVQTVGPRVFDVPSRLTPPSVARDGSTPALYVRGDTRSEGEPWFHSFELSLQNGAMTGGGGRGAPDGYARSSTPLPTFPSIEGVALIDTYRQELQVGSEFQFAARWSTDRGATLPSVAAIGEPREDEVGRFLMMPSGLFVVEWGENRLTGLDPLRFVAEVSNFRIEQVWGTSAETAWGDDAETTEVLRLAGPDSNVAVALLENGDGARKWVRIDRCGEATTIYESERLGREILDSGYGFIVQLQQPDEPDPRIAIVRNGELLAESTFGCRNLVEREPNLWACLSEEDGTYEAITFDAALEIRRTEVLPAPPGFAWDHAQLELAGADGVLVVRGFGNDGGEARHIVALVDGEDSMVTVIDDEVRLTEFETTENVGILGPNGVFAFSDDSTVHGVQTHVPGLADTRHPRAWWGGNQSLGYLEPL